MAQNIPFRLLLQKHRSLKLAGVTDLAVRNRIIALAWLRATDFAAWVKARARLSIVEVVEADGEEMQARLLAGKGHDGRGAFTRDEITLPAAPQREERRAV